MPKNIHATRPEPGADLRKYLQAFTDENNFTAAWISTCVGSLRKYAIRFADQSVPDTGDGHFEIISLTGTLSVNGTHLHICISDSTGRTIGGHLMDGCIIYTTAEIILESSDELIFNREKDNNTGCNELK